MPKHKTIKQLPDILKATEVAYYFRVRPRAVRRWARLGTIPSIVINSRGDRRFRKEDVIKILENGFDL